MGDHAQLAFGDPELDERVAAALVWTTTPSKRSKRRRQRPVFEAVRRGSRSCAVKTSGARVPEKSGIELGRREPLHVDDVGRNAGEPHETERVLERLQRQPQSRALEEPRRQRVEELSAPVPVGLGDGAEAKARGDEVDVGSRAGERRRELVVVRRA